MSSSNSYYYSLLDKPRQQAYHAMKEGFSAISPGFSVPRFSMRELSDIFFMLRLDHPELFYCVSFRCKGYPQADSLLLEPEYLFPKAKIQEHAKALEARIRKLIRPAERLDETGKEQFIHDFICTNVRYDKLKKPYSHEIIGPLTQGVGVCEGIAKTVKILCDRLGLWCVIALSDANPEKKIKYRHTWNVLRVGKSYCHLDATFDNSLGKGGMVRYDYYNLDDARFFRDHEPVIWPVPACTDNRLSYYQQARLSLTRAEDVRKRAARFAKKGQTFVFHWRGGYLTREVLTELLTLVETEATAAGRHALISLNWPQAVLCIRFCDEIPGENLLAEEANEGENPAEESETAAGRCSLARGSETPERID